MSAKDLFGQATTTEEESGIDKAVAEIASRLSYADTIEKLMQMTRATGEEKEAFAILYALNKGKLKSRVLTDFLYARFGLANSEKGKSRAELIDVIKASTPQVPKGFWGKMKEKVDF